MRIKKKLFFLGFFIFLFSSSCVLKSDYNKLEKEKRDLESELEKTKKELSDVNFKYSLLNVLLEEQEEEQEKIEMEKRQAEIEKNKKPYIKENQALDYIDDYYNFYKKDMLYRNVELRRIAKNSFRVSLETCTKKGDFSNEDFFWSSEVRTLSVYNNGKYEFDIQY